MQELATIDPGEVEAMPVDEQRLADLEREIVASGGIKLAVHAWRDASGRLHIMDGLHRCEAARRLKISAISAVVYDITEAEFWDNRISSAKEKGQVVTDQRLHLWMLEAWRLTPWSKRDDANFAQAAYEVYCYLYNRLKEERKQFNKEQRAVADWFDEKGAIWGKSATEVASIIVAQSGLLIPYSEFLAEAARQGVPYDKYCAVVSKVKEVGATEDFTRSDIKSIFSKSSVENVAAPSEVIRLRKEEDERRRKQQIARAEQMRNTEQGKAILARGRARDAVTVVYRVASVSSAIDELLKLEVDADSVLAVRQDVMARINDIFGAVNRLANWAGIEQRWQTNDLVAENEKLRQRVAQLEEQAKRQATVTPDALALSSTDISRGK